MTPPVSIATRASRMRARLAAGIALSMALCVAAACALTGCAAETAGASGSSGAAAVKPTASYVYATHDGQDLHADVCAPQGTAAGAGAPSPAIVLLHGGGFVGGSRQSMGSLCAQFAQQGVTGIAIDYRLLPDGAYPAPVDDARAALDWAAAHADELGIDPERIAMFGSSAGAIITATLAAEGTEHLAAAVALSPVADMTRAGLALGAPSDDAIASVLAYLGCQKLTDCDVAADASPTTRVTAQSTPLFMAVGSDELVPRQQPEALRSAFADAGAVSELVVVTGEKHGLSLMTSEVRTRLASFLAEHL